MRVVIAGGGNVGTFIAEDLAKAGHEVVIVEVDADRVAEAEAQGEPAGVRWIAADGCEVSEFARADVDKADVVAAVTGDDEDNLVISLLAKQEFAVPRVVARVNNPKNEWMFDDAWGVDVPVSTPRIMTALVEEAVAVGDLVKIFTFHQSGASIHEITLPVDSPAIGRRVGSLKWPGPLVLAAIIRGDRPIPPSPDDTLEAGDELLLITDSTADRYLPEVQEMLAPVREAR